MKRILCLFITLLSLTLSAQNISVASFELAPTDLTANLAGTTVLDQNGEKCALLRIQTTQTGFQFDVGTLGVQKTEQKTAEIWVYVPRGVRKITIRHQQLGTTEYDFPIAIESAKTYIMQLTTGKVETIVHNAVTSQYVLFEVSPKSASATIELNGQIYEVVDGTSTAYMPFGTYKYRVQAPKYAPKEGNITVNDPQNKHVIQVELEPQFANFTFESPNNSEIWINNKREGRGKVTLELGYGTYNVETRLENHRPNRQEVTLSANSSKNIQLKNPTPIYGFLNINSVPANADIYLDGEKIGSTPMFLSNILIGNHKLKLVKEGYKDYVHDFVLQEQETAKLTAKLEQGFSTEKKTFTVNGVSFEMIPVEGGTFTMGTWTARDDDEKNIHTVKLSNYYIGKTEVTQELWKAVMKKNPSHFKNDDLPVENISWNDCQEFIQKLNQLTGKNFRLPTEAEWEFAARGGKNSKSCQFAGNDNIDAVAWYGENSENKTHAVGTKQPNELGIYDMSGNVWEWCSDWYGSYSSYSQTNPQGPNTGDYCVGRGGSYGGKQEDCRVTNRSYGLPNYKVDFVGFRLVLGE